MAECIARGVLIHRYEAQAGTDQHCLPSVAAHLSAPVSKKRSSTAAADSLAKTAPAQLTIPITSASDGGSVQQCLSAAAWPLDSVNVSWAADKLCSLKLMGPLFSIGLLLLGSMACLIVAFVVFRFFLGMRGAFVAACIFVSG